MDRAHLSARHKAAGTTTGGTRTGPTAASVPPASHAAVRLSTPEDASEHAADRMAGNAMRQGTPEGGAPARAPAGAGGEPLPECVRNSLEQGFGADLGSVRVHHGQEAADAARSVSARAFTLGGDIAFGAGQYQPETARGQALIAHEVAHTLQAPDAGVVHREESASGDEDRWTPLATTPGRDPLRLSYADFLRLDAQRREPVRRWLDTNTGRLQLLSKCALTSRVRDAVPEASSLADIEVGTILDEWAAAHRLTIPRLSAIPQRCDTITPAAAGPSFVDRLGDSEVVAIISRGISLATQGVNVKANAHGRFNVSVSGLRVELSRGPFKVAGIVGFTGGYSFEADAGLFHFRASLDQERWEMSLSAGTELPVRLNARLARVFSEAETAMRRVLASSATLDPASVKSAIEQEMQRVSEAVDALARAAALDTSRFSVGVGAVGPGPGLPGPSTPPGTSVEVTLSVWF